MRLTERAHHYLTKHVKAGDLVIDATAGNGYDTVKLADLVGPTGRVIAIDLQAAAIAATQARLEAAQLAEHCQLVQADHSLALKQLAAEQHSVASAITFNLGYLPGSDKAVQTSAQSTLPALGAAWQLLKTNGLLLVTAYRGHAGGNEEAAQVAQWMHQHCPHAKSHEPHVTGDRIPPILWVTSPLRKNLPNTP